jgi:CheY-like chemotaxis protein
LSNTKPIEILLVEDNPADAELALHALRKSKAAKHVQVLRDGEQALDFLLCRGDYSDRRFEAPPRIVLLDLKLPKVDGAEVLRDLKANPRTKAIPVIVLTSSTEEQDMVRCYKLGANSYIQKPVSFAEFQHVLQLLGTYWLVTNSKPPEAAFSPA